MNTEPNNLPILLQFAIWAAVLIAFVFICFKVNAWTKWLEERRAERNERERTNTREQGVKCDGA